MSRAWPSDRRARSRRDMASDGGSRSVGGVVLFDARAKRLRPAPLEVKEGYVTSVAFGPEGRIAAGYGITSPTSAWRRGALRRSRRAAPTRAAEVKEGYVHSVAFGPEGRIAAGYGISARSRAAWCSSTPIPPRGGERQDRSPTATSRGSSGQRYFPDETTYHRTIRSLPFPHDLPEAERMKAEAFEKEHPEGSDAS